MTKVGPLRLQRALAEAGIASRRKAEELIRAGRVAVDGQVVTDMGIRVEPTRQDISVDGRPLPVATAKVVYVLHKPAGRITTCHDEQGRPTVLELVPRAPGLHPVGRLDLMTSGLLLLTNDGRLTHALTHPSHEIVKHYRAVVTGHPDDEAIDRLRQGVLLEDGPTEPCTVRVSRDREGRSVVELWIHEGRNRQVRRMLEHVGHRVRELVRLGIGPIRLGDLGLGCWREPRGRELEWLHRCVDGSLTP
ncbi:MAG: pseudouridine synthase [Candidatus Sericytochromatia bacterium]|nr:pseudouridine synthase [Candidatus Sericytochromatia bacterium]